MQIKKFLKAACKLAAITYVVFSVVVVIYQRDLIFLPHPDGQSTPAQFGTPFVEEKISLGAGGYLAAWWIAQASANASTPTLLYCHGNASTLSQLAHVSSLFYQSGWNVLLFDYRSYGKSSAASEGLSEASLQSDAKGAYDWLRSKGIAPKNIVIWGHSLGSAVAAGLASEREAAALILEGSFPSMVTMAHFRYPFLIIPDFLIWDKFNSAKYISSLKIPKLLIHAKLDHIIPIQFGKALFESAPDPKEWLEIEGIDHNDFPSVYKSYIEKIQRFVNAALMAGTKTSES